MLEILTDASKLKTARLANSGEMDYRHLPHAVRDVLATWDTDGSNSCLFDERMGGWSGVEWDGWTATTRARAHALQPRWIEKAETCSTHSTIESEKNSRINQY